MTLCQATLRLVALVALTVSAQEHCHGERRNVGYSGGSESASTSSPSGSFRGRTDNTGAGLGRTDGGQIAQTREDQSEYYGIRIRLHGLTSSSSCTGDGGEGVERNYDRPDSGDSGGPGTGDTDTNPATNVNVNLILNLNVNSHVATQSPTQTQTQTEAQTKTETHTETSTQTHTETATISEPEPLPLMKSQT